MPDEERRTIGERARRRVLREHTAESRAATFERLQEALAEVMADRTTFVITHLPSTVVAADRIVVLHGGRVVEEGAHAELMQRRGRYFELVQHQTRGLLPEQVGGGLAAT